MLILSAIDIGTLIYSTLSSGSKKEIKNHLSPKIKNLKIKDLLSIFLHLKNLKTNLAWAKYIALAVASGSLGFYSGTSYQQKFINTLTLTLSKDEAQLASVIKEHDDLSAPVQSLNNSIAVKDA